MNRILFIGIIAVITACGNRFANLPVLDLEASMSTGHEFSGAFTLNDIMDVVDIIPIETRPDALIGTANLLHIGKRHYYLRHDDKISCIDRDGKIVCTISRQGRGPGEYLEPTVVDVNEDTSMIRVFDMRGKKYITYDMDGLLIDKGSLGEKGFDIPRFIADDYMVVRGDGEGDHRLYITDRNMNTPQGLFTMDTTVFDRSKRKVLALQVAVGSGGNEALVNLAKEDTLYRVTKWGITPEAILHKGRYRLPKEPLVTVVTPDTPTYFTSTIVNSSSDYYFITNLILGRIMEIWNKADGQLIAHSDSRDGFDKFGFRFVFPTGGETRVSSFHHDGDTLAFIVDAVNTVDKVEGVKETDNPVIVVAKLK